MVDLSGYGVNGNTFDGRNELVHVADKGKDLFVGIGFKLKSGREIE